MKSPMRFKVQLDYYRKRAVRRAFLAVVVVIFLVDVDAAFVDVVDFLDVVVITLAVVAAFANNSSFKVPPQPFVLSPAHVVVHPVVAAPAPPAVFKVFPHLEGERQRCVCLRKVRHLTSMCYHLLDPHKSILHYCRAQHMS